VNLIVKDPLQRKIEIANWIVLAVIFIISWIFSPFDFYLGVLLGGVMVKYYIRLVLTAIVLYFLIANGTVHVIGLLIGLSVVVINIILTVITTLAKKKLLEEVI
jgi:hypothetical protein